MIKKAFGLGILGILMCSLFGGNPSVSAGSSFEVDYADYAPGVANESEFEIIFF